MTKNLNTARATDLLISLASKLPENLVVDTVNEKGNFSLSCLLRMTDEQLFTLKEEANKKKETVLLDFATIESGSTSCPDELRNFSDFDWNKVGEIRISGDTCPYLPNIYSQPIDYISVIFVIK